MRMQPLGEPRGPPQQPASLEEVAPAEAIYKDPLGDSACAAIRAVGIHQQAQMSLPTYASSEAGHASRGIAAVERRLPPSVAVEPAPNAQSPPILILRFLRRLATSPQQPAPLGRP